MADQPKTPRHLEVVKTKDPDLLRPLREAWWKAKAGVVTQQVTLAEAMSDVGVLALAHIARRLASEKTPEKVKDQLAIVMGPKLAVQLTGRGLVGRDRLATPATAGHGVLDTYRQK